MKDRSLLDVIENELLPVLEGLRREWEVYLNPEGWDLRRIVYGLACRRSQTSLFPDGLVEAAQDWGYLACL